MRRNVAQVSRKPGRTRAIHYYLVDDRYFIVDLPGVGYASVAKRTARRMQDILASYLERTPPDRLFLLLDVRRNPGDTEMAVISGCRERGIPCTPVLTKVDKVNRRNRQAAGRAVEERFGCRPIFTSARMGTGIREIRRLITGNPIDIEQP